MLCPLYIGLGLKCWVCATLGRSEPSLVLTCAPVKRTNDIEVTRLLLGWNEAVEVNMPWKLWLSALSTDLPTTPAQETVGLKCGFFETRLNPVEVKGSPFICSGPWGTLRALCQWPISF